MDESECLQDGLGHLLDLRSTQTYEAASLAEIDVEALENQQALGELSDSDNIP